MARKPFDNWQELLEEVLLKNELAIRLCLDLFEVSQTWDDLIDEPSVSEERLYASFWRAMVDIPGNPFYQENFNTLNPLIQAALADWMDANELQGGYTSHMAAAYALRDSITRIVIHCARIVGGYSWMRMIQTRITEALYDEDFETFKEEHSGQR